MSKTINFEYILLGDIFKVKSLFEGTAVAIVTPFANGRVDYRSFEKIIEADINQGVKAIVVLGTTGEGVSVSQQERKEIISFAKRVVNKRVKLIVGTGNNNFITCQENTIMAKELGADGVLVVTPYYNKTTQQGLVEYYAQLAKIGIPIIMYNVPSRTGLNIEVETVKKLLNCDMIYGLKESTCDINRIIELANLCHNQIALYSGEDALNYVFYCLGAQGAISVTANVLASDVQKVYDLVKSGEMQKALSLQNSLSEINHALFVETNPIPIKTFMSQMGMVEDEVRMPLVKASDKTISLIVRLTDKLKHGKEIIM